MRLWLLAVALSLAACGGPQEQRIRHPHTAGLEQGVAETLAAARADWDAQRRSRSGRGLGAAHGALGKVYLANHFTRAAADAFELASSADPDDYRWHYYHGLALIEQGEQAAAAGAFGRTLERKPDFWQAHYRLAHLHLAAGNLAASRPHSAAAMRTRPGDPAVRALAGELALLNQDYAAARTHFEIALRIAPSASRLYHPLARALRGEGRDVSPALLARAGDGEPYLDDPLTRSLAALAESAQIYLERGKVWLAQKDYDNAERAFRAALARNPDDSYARVSLGRVLEIRGDAQGARAEFAAALAADDGSATAHYFAGALAERQGDDPTAIEHYRRAVDLDAGYDRPRLLLAHALLRSGRDDDAAEHYERIAVARPANILVRYYLGMIRLTQGRCAAARVHLAEAAALQLNYAPVLEAQARLFSVCEASVAERSEAVGLARAIDEARPDSRSAVTLAIALAAGGERDAAIRWRERALERAATPSERAALAAFLPPGDVPPRAWPAGSADYRPRRLGAGSLE